MSRRYLPNYRRLLWEGRRWVAASVLIFFASCLVGFGVARADPPIVMKAIQPALGKLVAMGQVFAQRQTPLAKALLIYQNNLLALFAIMAIVTAAAFLLLLVVLALTWLGGGEAAPNGRFNVRRGVRAARANWLVRRAVIAISADLLLTIPVIFLALNGLLVGAVAGLGPQVSPLAASPKLIFASLVPHGMFELPALWLGAAWAMRLAMGWLRPSAAGSRLRAFGRYTWEAGQIFVLSAAMLFVAALIEANVTPAIVKAMGA